MMTSVPSFPSCLAPNAQSHSQSDFTIEANVMLLNEVIWSKTQDGLLHLHTAALHQDFRSDEGC